MYAFAVLLLSCPILLSEPLFSTNKLSELISSHSKQYANSANEEPLELPSAHFVSEPITLQNTKKTIVGNVDTLISPLTAASPSSLISLSNASLSLKSVTFSPDTNNILLTVDGSSAADLYGINILMNAPKSNLFFVDRGQLALHKLGLNKINSAISPLISCGKSGASISLDESEFESFATSGPDALIGNKNADSVFIRNTKFTNITMDNSFTVKDSYAPSQVCVSHSNIFMDCDNSYDGNIIAGMHSSLFVAANSTHMNEETVHREQTRVTSATSTSTFSNEEFVHCEAENDNGGAISLRYYGSVTVDSCKFYYCKATGGTGSGGAISTFSCHGESLTVSGSYFDNCTSSLYGGAITQEGIFSISSSNFTQCRSQFGGAISLNLVTANSSISDCIIKDCSTTDHGKGGAIYVYRANATNTSMIYITVSDIQFKNNSAAANGAGMYFSSFQLSKWAFYTNLTFTNLKFEDSELTAATSGHGVDIGAEAGWWFCIQDISFTNCESNSPRPHIAIRTADSDEYETHNDWMEDNGPLQWYYYLIIAVAAVIVVIIVVVVVLVVLRRYLKRKNAPKAQEDEADREPMAPLPLKQ